MKKTRTSILLVLFYAAISAAAVYVSVCFIWRITPAPYIAHIILLALSLFGLIFSFIRMIAENNKIEMLSSQNEETCSLLNTTLRSTADGILVVDLKGKVTFFNEQFLKIWGVPDYIAKKKDDLLLLNYVKEKLKEPELFLDGTLQMYSKHDGVYFDDLKFKDGRIIERYSIPQYFKDTVIGRVWSFRDITQHKMAEHPEGKGKNNIGDIVKSAGHGVSLRFFGTMAFDLYIGGML